MSKILNPNESYVRLLDSAGTAITLSSGKVPVDATISSATVSQNTHNNLNCNANIQVGDADVDNANPVPVSDAGGSLTVDFTNDVVSGTHDNFKCNATLQIGDADVDGSNAVPIKNDAGGVLTVDASSLDIRALTNSDTVSAEITKQPATTTALWSASAVSADAKSTALDTLNRGCEISFYGNCSGANTLTVEVSADDSNYYSTGITVSGTPDFDFFLHFKCSARYARLSTLNGSITITAYGSVKC